jgi:hypothetical protein
MSPQLIWLIEGLHQEVYNLQLGESQVVICNNQTFEFVKISNAKCEMSILLRFLLP